MTVEERLREWIADPSTNDGEFVSIRPDGVRELLAELTAKDAQIATAQQRADEAGFSRSWEEVERLIKINARHRKGFLLQDVDLQFVIDQARAELDELEAEPGDVDELADLLGVLFHFAIKVGWSTQQIENAMLNKLKERFTTCSPPAVEQGADERPPKPPMLLGRSTFGYWCWSSPLYGRPGWWQVWSHLGGAMMAKHYYSEVDRNASDAAALALYDDATKGEQP